MIDGLPCAPYPNSKFLRPVMSESMQYDLRDAKRPNGNLNDMACRRRCPDTSGNISSIPFSSRDSSTSKI